MCEEHFYCLIAISSSYNSLYGCVRVECVHESDVLKFVNHFKCIHETRNVFNKLYMYNTF